jgi:DNA anti-recombination protein RmuC
MKDKEENIINKQVAKMEAGSKKFIDKQTATIKKEEKKALNLAIKLLKEDVAKAKKDAAELEKATGINEKDIGKAVGLYDALFHGNYRQGTWMCILLGIFN